MRARIFFYVSLVVLAGGIFVTPQISHALYVNTPVNFVSRLKYTGLSWTNPNIRISIAMKDGGTYSVPFSIGGDTQAGIAGGNFFDVEGILYHISATSSARTFSAGFDGDITVPFAWSQEGKYELDLYKIPPPELMIAPWWRRGLAFLIGKTAYAADTEAPIFVKTIHFTIKDADNPCGAPNSCTDNVLFIPGTEASRLYYRGEFGLEHQVWEPDWHTDIPYLAMNSDGTSKYKLYTKDVIGKMEAHNPLESTIAKIFKKDLEVYGKFENFLNRLVASSTINAWKAYPYDWRYDVRDVVKNGTLTELPDGSIKRVYLVNVLKRLASTSKTKKVTIVAHSNGGLVAKALVQYLGADASKYIDRIIVVGTPQWGTPSSIGVMLHGDGETMLGGLVMNGAETRTIIDKLPDAYDLLPSRTYFAHVADPVVVFKTDDSISGKFATQFGSVVTSFSNFSNFLEDSAGLDAQTGGSKNLYAPVPLSSSILAKASATHFALDKWTPPFGISFTAIAGWGQDTVKTLLYTTKSKTVCNALTAGPIPLQCEQVPYLEHTATTTQDGDGTVVSPSAVGKAKDSLYFDTVTFKKQKRVVIVHRNLMAAYPIQNTIKDLLDNTPTNSESYIQKAKPTSSTTPIKLRISTHSPVNIVVTDSNGAQSGVLQIPGTDFSGIKRDIIGGSVHIFDDEEYVTVPKNGVYHIIVSGYAHGFATIQVETIKSDGGITTSALFADIPTSASSTVSFIETNGVSSAPKVDIDGDGKTDLVVASSVPGADPLAYVRYMKNVIDKLGLQKSTQHSLDMRLSAIEHQIEFPREWFNGKTMHRMHKRVHVFRNKKILLILRPQLSSLTHFVEWQFGLSAKLSKLKMFNLFHMKGGLSEQQAELIINMINQLKSLL
ncbi:hypothetical protein MNBD_CPR01-609 [hydrothermal vent metagenome]|uniref:Uncharacterized protein n=1 Tax=hydrothermal vent metagenome TaxID=652676 RepID=A0A3B0UMS0_9ZZZZ